MKKWIGLVMAVLIIAQNAVLASVDTTATISIPRTLELKSYSTDPVKGEYIGNHSVHVRMYYEKNGEKLETGFYEHHQNVEHQSGWFRIIIGSIMELKKEYMMHEKIQLALWNYDENNAVFYNVNSYPFAYFSEMSNTAKVAQSVDWDTLAMPQVLKAVVSTANYASRALLADSANTAQSVLWSNIIGVPSIPVSAEDIQGLGISSMTSENVLSLVQNSALDFSKNSNGQHTIFISNSSYNNQTGASLFIKADEGKVISSIKSTKDISGQGQTIIGSESNHSVVFQQNGHPAITINSANIIFNRPIQLDWDSNQNLPVGNAITFKKDVGVGNAIVGVKNLSNNVNTSAILSVLGSNGAISGYLKAEKNNLGVGSVRLGSSSESTVFIDYNSSPALEIGSNSIILHKQITLAPGLGSTLNIAVQSANNAIRSSLSDRSTVADSANSVDWSNVLNKPTGTTATTLDFSTPSQLNSFSPTFQNGYSTGILSMRIENTMANTDAGSEYKVIADSGTITAKIGGYKTYTGKKVVYMGSESDSELWIIRADNPVMTITSTGIIATLPFTATSISGNGSLITQLDPNNINGTVPDSKLNDTVTKKGNVFNGANQLVQLDSNQKFPSKDGSQITLLSPNNINGNVPDSKLNDTVTKKGNVFNGASQLVQLDSNQKFPAKDGSQITLLKPNNINGTVPDSKLNSTVTKKGNVFNGAIQLVHLDSNQKFPAKDGSQITLLNPNNINGTVPDSKLNSTVTKQGNIFNGANQLVKLDANQDVAVGGKVTASGGIDAGGNGTFLKSKSFDLGVGSGWKTITHGISNILNKRPSVTAFFYDASNSQFLVRYNHESYPIRIRATDISVFVPDINIGTVSAGHIRVWYEDS